MRAVLFLFVSLAALTCGLWMGQEKPMPRSLPSASEKKPFVLLVYSCNSAPWCEKALESIFEQDYEAYRVIVIDDASCDGSAEWMQSYVLQNNQEERCRIVQNSTRLGLVESLKRAFHALGEVEIGVFLNAVDWLCSPDVLSRLNHHFQNRDVWWVSSRALAYPSYEIESEGLWAVQGALAKNSSFSSLEALKRKAKGHIATLRDPLQLKNETVQTPY